MANYDFNMPSLCWNSSKRSLFPTYLENYYKLGDLDDGMTGNNGANLVLNDTHGNSNKKFESSNLNTSTFAEHSMVTDGGKDAEGVIKFGKLDDTVDIDYALEAKCYKIDNSCGSKEVSRLISRIRQKMVGVFVTTSFVNPNTLKEVKEDNHPVIFITALDIVDILKERDIVTKENVKNWLSGLDYTNRG